ncbi:MAG: alpha/beta hydrolase [Spirochaetes bacterium]|nr:alpha/beta hydrolase [Spirochaetota bacterium]
MKKTIVMIHGMWLGNWVWDKFKNTLQKKGYHCITPTLRFHDGIKGKKPDPKLGKVSILDYVSDIEKEIRKLKEPPVLMGHSMGGLIAQILASRGMARSVVLLNPAPPAGLFMLRPTVIKSFFSGLFRWKFWSRPHRQTFDEAVYSMMQLLPFNEQKKLYDKLVFESGRAYTQIGFSFLDFKRPTKVDEKKITCPMLIIAGTQDKIVPIAVLRKIAKKYKKVAVYREYSNHAHWTLSEPGWQEIIKEVHTFLKTSS